MALIFVGSLAFIWWRDVIRESLLQGAHTFEIQNNLKLRIILFIFREVIFFIGFFWAFLHASLSPTIEIGLIWPPISVNPLNPFRIPFLNTLVLLRSGVTVTWRHHSLINNLNSKPRLLGTVVLGAYFSLLQAYEYIESSFSIRDSVFGRTFFIGTGFHGFHVLVGSLFLLICFLRKLEDHFSNHHLIGFEIRIWYWHFVDVVWLFLFSVIYWWGV